MKNLYETRGDITVIKVKQGKELILDCLIDTKDLELVDSSCDTNWHMSNNGKDRFYVTGSKKVNGKLRTVKLHRVVTQAPKGMVVDHTRGNTLDNRGSMLRVVTQVENMQNSKVHSTNTSGVRGLYYHNRSNLWIGGIWANKEYHHIGCWKPNKFEEAKESMKKAYTKLHPYTEEIKNNDIVN